MYKENCIKITLDTSVIEPDDPIIKQLVELINKGFVKFYIDGFSELEKEAWVSEKKEEVLMWMDKYCHQDQEVFLLPEGEDIIKTIETSRGFTFKEENETELKVRSVHSPEIKKLSTLPKGKKGLSKYSDWQILNNHISYKRDYFLTKNTKEFIDKGKQKGVRLAEFESLFPDIKIREPNHAFLEEIKSELIKRGIQTNSICQ